MTQIASLGVAQGYRVYRLWRRLIYGLNTAMTRKRVKNPRYCFIDIDLRSRQLIGWGTETKDKVEVRLTPGFHRVFLTQGQYNKLERQLREI